MKKEHRLLFENIFSLTSLQGLQYVFSLILVPYLLRVLGPERFGAIALMQGVVQYANLFVNYGFNLTAPRDIAQAEEAERPRIFAAFFSGKVLSFLVVTAVVVVLWCVAQLTGLWALDGMLFLAVYTMVIGNVLFPIFLFQGLQQMRYITLLNVVGRLATMGGVFLLVRAPEDYLLAALFQSCTPILAGLGALWIIARSFPGYWCWPSWADIRRVYLDGWHIFISTVAINAYTASNVVILGALTNNTLVGYYSGANKLIDCVKQLLTPISQAIYPYISSRMQKDSAGGMHFLRRLLVVFGSIGMVLGIVLLAGAEPIVRLILGEQYLDSIGVLRIMAFVPFMVALSNVLGIQTMLPLGMERAFSRILLVSAVLNTAVIFPLTMAYGAEGTALTMLITETFVTGVMGIVLYRARAYR